MNKTNVHIGLLVSLVAALAISVITMQSVAAQTTVIQGYPASKRVVGAAAGAITTTIKMSGMDELAFVLQASGGNFGSKFLIVSASVDNTNFIQIDNISLSTNTISVKQYDATHLGSGVAVNPAVFPFVKVAQSAGNAGVTPTLTYSTR